MAIYYECANISTLRARCARYVLYCEPTELAQVQTVYKTPLSREIAGRGVASQFLFAEPGRTIHMLLLHVAAVQALSASSAWSAFRAFNSDSAWRGYAVQVNPATAVPTLPAL